MESILGTSELVPFPLEVAGRLNVFGTLRLTIEVFQPSDPVRRRFDTLVTQIYLGLTPMMRHVYVHGQQNLAAGEASVGRVVRFAELSLIQRRDHSGAVVEGIAQELNNFIFAGCGGQLWRVGVLQASTELIASGCDVRHQLPEVHGLRMRPEAVLVRRHCLSYRYRELAEGREVLRVLSGGRRRGLGCACDGAAYASQSG